MWLHLLPLLLLLLLTLPTINQPCCTQTYHCQHLVNNTRWTSSSLLLLYSKIQHTFSITLTLHPSSCTFLFLSPPFTRASTMQSWESTMPPPVSQWPFIDRARGSTHNLYLRLLFRGRLNLRVCLFLKADNKCIHCPQIFCHGIVYCLQSTLIKKPVPPTFKLYCDKCELVVYLEKVCRICGCLFEWFVLTTLFFASVGCLVSVCGLPTPRRAHTE